MFCKNCGNRVDGKFCSICGTPVDPPPQPVPPLSPDQPHPTQTPPPLNNPSPQNQTPPYCSVPPQQPPVNQAPPYSPAPQPAGEQPPYYNSQQQPFNGQPTIIINNNNTNTNVNAAWPNNGKPLNKWLSFLLCLFLGYFGAHKFYEGKILLGIVYIFTGGLCGIGWLIDTIAILLKPNPYYV